MPNARYLVFLVILSFMSSRPAIAHTSIDKKIADLTKLIQQSPNNTKLYLIRGELYRVHREWSKAMADFNRVTDSPEVNLYIGRLFLESDQPEKAENTLKIFVECKPEHSRARVFHARALLKLNRRIEAVEEYTQAIRLDKTSGPELYIERAKALTDEGDFNLDEALDGLDAGIQELGQLVTLQLFAIDLELKKKRFNDALFRLDKITEKSPRKETYLARRGEILEKAGRMEEGQKAYTETLSAIHNLPINLRKTQVMVQLKKRVLNALDRLKTYNNHKKGGTK